MRFALMLPVFFTLDDLADEITRGVWTAVISQPKLQRLYPGYFVAIHSVVFGHLRESLASNTREADGRHCLVFEGAGDLDVFKVKLAGAIVIRLDEVLRQAHALDLITREIPGAVHQVLHAHVCTGQPVPRPATSSAHFAVPLSSAA